MLTISSSNGEVSIGLILPAISSANRTPSGSWFLISYTTYFLVVSGLGVDEAFKYSVMKSCLGFIGVNLGIYLMRHVVGRRTIMMIGSLTQGLCMLIIAITATTSPGTLVARNCLIAFTSLYMFCYNAFVGAASYPVATELVSTRLRSWTVGSAISLGYFLAWLTGFCSPYFINPENMNWVCLPPLFLRDTTSGQTLTERKYRAQSMATFGRARTLPVGSSSFCVSLSSRDAPWRRLTNFLREGSEPGSSSRQGPPSWMRS